VLVVGGGLVCVRYLPGLTSIGPWIVASLYVVVLGLIMAWRFESGAWRKFNLLGAAGVMPPPTAHVPEDSGLPADLSGPLTSISTETEKAFTAEDAERR
jgi:hypothetical protein